MKKFFINLFIHRLDLILYTFYLAAIFVNYLIRHGNTVSGQSSCPQLTFYSSPNDIINCFGGSDIASYVRGAFALEEHGLNAFGSLGFGTWPPGFSMLELIIIRLDILPLPLALLILASMLWAFVFLRLYSLLKEYVGLQRFQAAVIPILLLIVPFVSDFYLWEGVLMPEPISTAIFTIAALDLWRLIASGVILSTSKAISIGVLLSLATFLKAQFDLIFHSLVIISVFLILINYYYYLIKSRNKFELQLLKKISKNIFIIFISYQSLVLPYKIFMGINGHGFNMASVTYIFENVWRDQNSLIQGGAGFFVSGGGNSICMISPLKCSEFDRRKANGDSISIYEYRNSALEVALTRPFDLIAYKLPYFINAWEADNHKKSITLIFFNYSLFLLIILSGIYRVIKMRKKGLIEAALFFALFVGTTTFSFIVHFESRYLLPIKLFGAIWVMIVIASYYNSFDKRCTKPCSTSKIVH